MAAAKAKAAAKAGVVPPPPEEGRAPHLKTMQRILVVGPNEPRANPIHREKVVMERIGAGYYVVLNMDGAVQTLDLSVTRSLRFFRQRNGRVLPDHLPSNLARNQVEVEEDFVDQLTRQELVEAREEAKVVAQEERVRLRLPALAGTGDVGIGFLIPGADPEVPEGYVFIAAQPVAAFEDRPAIGIGDRIELDGTEAGLGPWALKRFDPDITVKIKLVRETEIAAARRELRAGDRDDPRVFELRTLPGTTERGRLWQGVAAESKEEDAEDWPVEGPRIGHWCTKQLQKIGMNPVEYSTYWAHHSAALAPDHPDAELHLQLCEAVRDFGCYDQVDPSNLAGVERVWRMAAYTEYKYMEKKEKAAVLQAYGGADAQGGGGGGKGGGSSSSKEGVTELERNLFMGSRAGRGQGLVPPELVKWLSGELREVNKVQKNTREAYENAVAERERLKKK